MKERKPIIFWTLLFGTITLSFAWAEPPSRSIFQQAKIVEPEKAPPAESPKKETLLLEVLGLGDIQIPEAHGRVVEVYEGNSGKIIIHIQDAHVHYEAQKNLAAILESLIRRNHLRLILIEGGSLRGELASLRKLASKEAREAVAERYLRKGLLAGDAYLELVSDYPMIRQGIENPALYEENVRSFMEIERFKGKALAHLSHLREVLEALKEKIYGPAHLDLEAKREAYDSERMELVEYYQYLTSLKNPSDYPNIQRLLEASRLEQEIDFEKVVEERNRLIEELTKTLTETETNEFVDRSLAFQEGDLSQKAYYEMLKNLAIQKNVVLTPYPHLEKYAAYLSLYEAIRHSELFLEGDRLEKEVRETLVRSEDERQLVVIDKHLKLLMNLFHLKVSPSDYAIYQENRLRLSVKAVLPFLESKIKEHRLPMTLSQEVVSLDDFLATLDRFYRIAQSRDVAFVENTLKEMEKENVKVAVLKTGGFHTPGLVRILKEKGISYLVISPKITEAGNPELYYSVLKETSGPRVQ